MAQSRTYLSCSNTKHIDHRLRLFLTEPIAKTATFVAHSAHFLDSADRLSGDFINQAVVGGFLDKLADRCET